jgi:hypothetical protein
MLGPLLAAALAATAPDPDGLDCRYPDVRPADAREFGCQFAAAGALRRAAWQGRAAMQWQVRSWNTDEDYRTWLAETEWRHRAWSLLKDALDPDPPFTYGFDGRRLSPAAYRLKRLSELRGHLGEEAYDARWMPRPLCRYRLGPGD